MLGKKDNFQKKYENLKVFVDEISIFSKLTFNDLNVNMQKIFDEDGILNLDFGGKSMLVIGDFLQLPSPGRKIFEQLTPTDTWHLFKLLELSEIVRQNSDPKFAELLNRLRVHEQTQSDIAAIHAIVDTDISHWLKNHFRSYMTNHLVGKQNMDVMNNATNAIFTIHAVDGRADGQRWRNYIRPI